MKSKKNHPKHSDIVVKIIGGSGELEDIVIRNTFERVELGGKDYFRYQIIKPKGYEKEEIIHLIGGSYKLLVCSVFMTLAEARSWQPEKTSGANSPHGHSPGSGGNYQRRHSCFEPS